MKCNDKMWVIQIKIPTCTEGVLRGDKSYVTIVDIVFHIKSISGIYSVDHIILLSVLFLVIFQHLDYRT